jgi:DNA (cytosine-5)-methyltransferase 1
MAKPRALDLCCKAGGASVGLYHAGFDVTGVDLEYQPRYPFNGLFFPFRFIQADALTFPLAGYDFIWASPPCQHYSHAAAPFRNKGKIYPDIVASVRERLISSRSLYAIENVLQAPLIDPIILDGTMFPDLKVIRRRAFECNFYIEVPESHISPGLVAREGYSTVVGGGRPSGIPKSANPWHTQAAKEKAMGIDWMSRPELSNAVPPRYAQYIAGWALRALSLPDHLITRSPDVPILQEANG